MCFFLFALHSRLVLCYFQFIFLVMLSCLCASARESSGTLLLLHYPNPSTLLTQAYFLHLLLLHWSPSVPTSIFFFDSYICNDNLAQREGTPLLNLVFDDHQFQWRWRLTWWRGWFLCLEFALIFSIPLCPSCLIECNFPIDPWFALNNARLALIFVYIVYSFHLQWKTVANNLGLWNYDTNWNVLETIGGSQGMGYGQLISTIATMCWSTYLYFKL